MQGSGNRSGLPSDVCPASLVAAARSLRTGSTAAPQMGCYSPLLHVQPAPASVSNRNTVTAYIKAYV